MTHGGAIPVFDGSKRCDVWLTPRSLLHGLGEFDLDPCAAPDPRPWPTAREHWTARGLDRPWIGRVWCNPPYSAVGAWLAAMAAHGNGLALVFARTDTTWFHEHVFGSAHAALFVRGRVFFHHAEGTKARSSAGASSVLVAYGAAEALRLNAACARGKVRGRLLWLRSEAFVPHGLFAGDHR